MKGTWPIAAGWAGGVLTILATGCSGVTPSTEVDSPGVDMAAVAPGAADILWQEPQPVARGPAIRGRWQMNDSEFHYVDDPTVTLTATGTIGVAWANQSKQDIFLQLYEPDGEPRLPGPINVSRSPGIFSWLPKMVIQGDEASTLYLLWQDIVFSGGSHGGEIFFARSTDGGHSFSPPINLSNTTAGAGKGRLTAERWSNGSFDLAQGPEGRLYAVWSEYEGNLRFSYSTDGGQQFSTPQTLVSAGDVGAPARGPTLAVAADGTVYLAWAVGDDDAANIYFSHSTDQGGSFAAPSQVHDSEGHADAPDLAIDSEGTLHLVYAESPGGSFRRSHIYYTQRSPGRDRFRAPKDITGGHAQKFERVSFPDVALDGDDRLYVVWDLFPEAAAARPRGLGLTVSEDGGHTFSEPSIVPGTADPSLGINGSLQGLLMTQLAVNHTGAIAIVNSSFRANHFSYIWLIQGQLNPTKNRRQE